MGWLCFQKLQDFQFHLCHFQHLVKMCKNLIDNNFILNRTLIDTVYFNLKIDKQGNVSYDKIQIDANLNTYKNAIETALNITIENLPKVYPALKRGQPVDVEFNFPLLISTEN